LSGKVLTTHRLPRLYLHAIVITPDEQHLLGVATFLESPDGLSQRGAREETCVIGTLGCKVEATSQDLKQYLKVYDMAEKTIQRCGVPIAILTD
jgi:hypothetical protein